MRTLETGRRVLALLGSVTMLVVVAACGDDSGGVTPPPPTYRVGGTVTGLSGGTLVLARNGGETVSITADGSFTFATELADGTSFNVTVSVQPSGQTCTVSNGSGTISGADVTSVAVTCSANTFAVGGVVAGLSGGTLVLQNNGGDDLSITANGSFTFAAPIADGAAYAVTVASEPPGQTCTVSNGSGTVTGADVIDVVVTCGLNTYTVGGTVTGLTGGTLVLQNNGADDIAITADGAFTFSTPLTNGANYVVSVSQQPSGQTCGLSNQSGTVSAENVTNVVVTCGANSYTVGGTVSGLSGSNLVLQNNGGDDLSLTANGAFAFSTPLLNGSSYSVTVATAPIAQSCTVSNGNGTIAAANVTDIAVSCVAIPPLTGKIVFFSTRDAGNLEIYVMDSSGFNPNNLTQNGADDLWPAVSADGRQIAFQTNRDGNFEIYTMNVDGSGLRRVTTAGAADREPAWSPDGSRIAFSRTVSGGSTDIYTVRADGTDLRRLTVDAADDQYPAWSPDGLTIAFTTNRDGNDEIYVMNALDGTAQLNLTKHPGRDGRPEWSPDGSKILFDRNDSNFDASWLGSAEIMCMNADGLGVVQMTADAAGIVDFQPRWSPSGARLVFSSDRDGIGVNNELYAGDTNDCVSPISGLSRLTISNGKDEGGDWSP